MVVGNGMMAVAFSAFNADPSVMLFASGVSNSLETDPAPFARETDLLLQIRESHPKALLVYFSTCSIHDPDRRDTPYVRHKLAMEATLAACNGRWLVLRIPLAIGPGQRGSTLAPFLYERISRGESFDVWANAVRFPIDVDDLVRIVGRLVKDRGLWNRTINVALGAFPVLDFVRAMEKIVGKSAICNVVQKGKLYEVHCPEVAAIAAELNLDFGPQYLERVLLKYFARP